jgi:hypothetical protein
VATKRKSKTKAKKAGNPGLSVALMQAAIDAVVEHGTVVGAAAAMKLPRGTLEGRLRAARLADLKPTPEVIRARAERVQELAKQFTPVARPSPGFEIKSIATEVDVNGKTQGQWIGERLEGRVTQNIPDGHLVKGLSTLVDESGRTRAQWIKTSIDQDKFRAMTEAACRAAAEKIPRVARIAGPKVSEEDLATLYTLTDSHVGMLAWGRETGEPWDLTIAENVLTDAMIRMIDAAPASAVGIVNQLGDFLHFDSMMPVTPTSGHILDADSRYQKVVEVAVRILRKVVEYALKKHREVRVYMHEGNHDMTGSIWLRVLFSALYENNPRVIVERSPQPYVTFQWGKTLLGFHHGHLAKKTSLPLLFAAKFSKQWGETTKRYIHVGHQHHVDEKEHPGVKVIQHPTLAAADAYSARGGWFSERQAAQITYHKERGEYSRSIFLPEE